MEGVEKASRGAAWMTVASIIILAAFLVGSLVYVGFYAAGYTLFQKIVVFLVALIIGVAAVSLMWVSLAARMGWRNWWEPRHNVHSS